MLVTRSGIAALVVCVGVGVVGFLAAIPEMIATGAVGIGVIVADAIRQWVFSPPADLSRSLSTERTSVGRPVGVQVVATMPRRWSRRSFRLVDRIDGAATAPRTVEVDRSERSAALRYEVTPTRRGIVALGPLTTESIPLLGAAIARSEQSDHHPLIVHPEVIDVAAPLAPPGVPAGRDVRAGDAADEPDIDPGPLRPYVAGDDVRRIHWPTSARTDSVVIRTDDPPSGDGPVIIVDPREAADADALDRATSMAASILDAQLATRRPARLACVGAARPIDVTDGRGLTDALDLLATVDDRRGPAPERRRPAPLSGSRHVILCSARPGSPLILSEGGLPDQILELVIIDASGHPPERGDGVTGRYRGTAVRWVNAGGDDIGAEWNALMSLRRDRAHVTSTGSRP